MSSSSRICLDNWLKQVDVKGSVLDVGGSVQGLKGRVKTYEPTEYLIMDNDSEKHLHEKWTEPDIKADVCQHISTTQSFDQVFMIEVSEYLIDPLKALKNVYSMLKFGGEFYFTTHFYYAIHNNVEDDIYRYTPKGITKLLKLAGFENIQITPRLAEKPQNIFNMISDERMRAARGQQHNVTGSLIKAVK